MRVASVDHEARLEPLLDIPEHIGQHEPPFGIGIDDLDGLAGQRLDDIARPLGIAIRHVLDKADGPDHIDGRPCGSQAHASSQRQRQHRHIALHILHAGSRLDRDAAGIEHDTLADEGERLITILARRSNA